MIAEKGMFVDKYTIIEIYQELFSSFYSEMDI